MEGEKYIQIETAKAPLNKTTSIEVFKIFPCLAKVI